MSRDGRRFATILFTDIVGSTDIATELGDRRWRELVRRHHAIVRRELKRFEGREVDTAGDGFFATFDSPGAAIRCACAVSEAVREVGLEVRAGLHAGEVETEGGKAGGIAVNTAARVMAVGGPGEVLVSGSLHDVVAGSSLRFADLGVHQLKGIPGEWRIFGVTELDGVPRGGVLDPSEAAQRRLGLEPATGGRGRRTRVLIAGAIAIVLAGAAAAIVLSGGDDGGAAATGATGATAVAGGPAPGSVLKIDLATGEVVLENEDVPESATQQFDNEDLEIGEGSVWLVRGRYLLKVDPTDGSATRAGGGVATIGNQGIAPGFGEIWLARDGLYPIDPGTGEPADPVFASTEEREFRTTDVATGLDRVWAITIDGELLVVDPSSLRVDEVDIGGTTEHIAVGEEGVWILDEFEGAVIRVDPDTLTETQRIAVSGGLDAVATGEGFVWVLDSTFGVLTPIEEASGDTRAPIDVGDDTEDVAVGAGSLWVAAGGSILEINPTTFQIVRTIEVGAVQILEVAADPGTGALWVSLEGSGGF